MLLCALINLHNSPLPSPAFCYVCPPFKRLQLASYIEIVSLKSRRGHAAVALFLLWAFSTRCFVIFFSAGISLMWTIVQTPIWSRRLRQDRQLSFRLELFFWWIYSSIDYPEKKRRGLVWKEMKRVRVRKEEREIFVWKAYERDQYCILWCWTNKQTLNSFS